MDEYIYRYDDIRFSLGCDQFDNPYLGYNLELMLSKYKIVRKTPKGCWISFYHFDDKPDKFILLTAYKSLDV